MHSLQRDNAQEQAQVLLAAIVIGRPYRVVPLGENSCWRLYL